MMPTSAPISLPKTHIHRTPSDIQLAADTLRAEYRDVAMYSRLMTGMHNQIQHRCLASGNGDADVHPMSWKSMQGIVKTKQANDYDLEQHDDNDDDDGWGMTYSLIDEETEHCSITSSQESDPPSRQALNDSFTTLLSDIESGDLEDDCLFSLELWCIATSQDENTHSFLRGEE